MAKKPKRQLRKLFNVDDNKQLIPLTMVLCHADKRFIDTLYPISNFKFSFPSNGTPEISLDVPAYIEGEINPLYSEVTDFKLIYIPEWQRYYQIGVSETENDSGNTKNITGIHLSEAELGQLTLNDIGINDDSDILRDDYKVAPIWSEDSDKQPNTVLGRIMHDKGGNYKIGYVSPSLQSLVRTFTVDGTTIIDWLRGDFSEELDCVVECDSVNDEINIYDTLRHCNYKATKEGEETKEGQHRWATNERVCPRCAELKQQGYTIVTSDVFEPDYGEFTDIIVTTDNIAESLQFNTDKDAVKTCFRIKAGDDLTTAAAISTNAGSEYIYNFSDEFLNDMPEELKKALEDYEEYYDSFMNEGSHGLRPYKEYLTDYYRLNDEIMELEHSKMPSREKGSTKAETECEKIMRELDNVDKFGLSTLSDKSKSIAENTIEGYAKLFLSEGYRVKVIDSTYQYVKSEGQLNCSLYVYNYTDEDNDNFTETGCKFLFTNDYKTFIELKAKKIVDESDVMNWADALDKDSSITNLFAYGATLEMVIESLNKTDRWDSLIPEKVKTGAKYVSDHFFSMDEYSISMLSGFSKSYDECITVLAEQINNINVDNQEITKEKVKILNILYIKYLALKKAIDRQMAIYEDEDEDKIIELREVKSEMEYIIEHVNLQTYLEEKGDGLWESFLHYRRDDEYTNDNFIQTDDKDNTFLLKNASEFLEKANIELYKAAQTQYSISGNIANFFMMDGFDLDKSAMLGNWLYVQNRISKEVYTLRLNEISGDYSSLDKINLTFSNAYKFNVDQVADMLSDTIAQAAGMATSFPSVAQQAGEGTIAKSTIDDWVRDGLNSALVNVKNNDKEEITIDNRGIIGREFDDTNLEYEDYDWYSPEQLRITHNILTFTEDNWETASLALGKHNYKKYVNDVLKDDTAYGLTAQFVTAGVVSGSQVIAGKIYSSNYIPPSDSKAEEGTKIDLDDGSFRLAGGRIVYNQSTNTVKLQDVTLDWSKTKDTDGTTITKGLSDAIATANSYSDSLADNYDSRGAAETAYNNANNYTKQWLSGNNVNLLGDDFVISPYIGGGYLYIVSDIENDKSSVLINPKAIDKTGAPGSIFSIKNSKGTEVIGMTTEGNATFTGAVTATSLSLSSSIKITPTNISGLSTNDISGINAYQTTEDFNKAIANYTNTEDLNRELNKYATNEGVEKTLENYAKSTDLPPTVSIVQNSTKNGVTTREIKIGDNSYTTYSASSEDGCMVYGFQKGSRDTEKYSTSFFKVSKEGLLEADNAVIHGKIWASSGEFIGTIKAGNGDVGGWNIATDSLWYAEEGKGCGFQKYGSTGTKNTAIWAGAGGVNVKDKQNAEFRVDYDGSVYCKDLHVTGGDIRINSNQTNYITIINETDMAKDQAFLGGFGVTSSSLDKNTNWTKTTQLKLGNLDFGYINSDASTQCNAYIRFEEGSGNLTIGSYVLKSNEQGETVRENKNVDFYSTIAIQTGSEISMVRPGGYLTLGAVLDWFYNTRPDLKS